MVEINKLILIVVNIFKTYLNTKIYSRIIMFNLQDYVNFETLFGNNELNKEYAEEKGLRVSVHKGKALLRYDKNKLNNENIKTLGLFRSVIYDIDNKKIICFSPPKSHAYTDFSENNDYDACIPMKFVEGTMINIYWDSSINDVEISTKSNIGANCYFNVSKNKASFREMYFDAMKDIMLRKSKEDNETKEDNESWYSERKYCSPKENYCYSTILQHTKNRIVSKITKNDIYLIGIYKINDGFVVEPKYDKLVAYHKKYTLYSSPFYKGDLETSTNFQELNENYHNKNLDYTHMGMIVYSPLTGFHTKIRNKNYEYVRRLKGNNIKPQYRYHELRKEDKVYEFLQYYPEYNSIFNCYRDDMNDMVTRLYSLYVDCFIKHHITLKNAPYQFKPHIYNLHGMYLNELRNKGEFITKNKVEKYVNNLEIPKLMYFMNYNLKNNQGLFDKFKKENNSETSEDVDANNMVVQNEVESDIFETELVKEKISSGVVYTEDIEMGITRKILKQYKKNFN